MGRFCDVGSEPKGNPAEVFYFDDGVLCSALDIRHPLCVLIDRIWHTTAKVLNLDNPSEAPRQASKFLWSWARAFGNAAIEDATLNGITAAKLCATDPPDLPQVTYGDLLAFLAGENDEILVKARAIWLFELWFEKCRCKPNAIATPTSAPRPVFSIPAVPYCGGVVAPPSQASLGAALQPLYDFVDRAIAENAIAVAEFADLEQRRLIEDDYVVQESNCDFLAGYRGLVGTGYLTLPIPTPPPKCFDSHPDYLLPISLGGSQRVVMVIDEFWQIDVAVAVLYHNCRSNARREIAESELLWCGGPGTENIPQGTMLSSTEGVEVCDLALICWSGRFTLTNLPPCPQFTGQFGQWGTPPNDPNQKDDDIDICLRFPSLCAYAKPCCGRAQTVLLSPKEQVLAALAFGYEVAPEILEALGISV